MLDFLPGRSRRPKARFSDDEQSRAPFPSGSSRVGRRRRLASLPLTPSYTERRVRREVAQDEEDEEEEEDYRSSNYRRKEKKRWLKKIPFRGTKAKIMVFLILASIQVLEMAVVTVIEATYSRYYDTPALA